MTALRLCPALLVQQIHGCILINTIGHVAFVCYLRMICQPFLLNLYLLAASVPLLLLCVHAHITKLRSFIIRRWLLVRSLFTVLWFSWCFWTVLGNVSHFSAIVAHWSLLLKNSLYIIHLSLYWKFLEGLERLLYLESVLYVLLELQHNCHDFILGCISHCLRLCLYKSLQLWFQAIYEGVYGIFGH